MTLAASIPLGSRVVDVLVAVALPVVAVAALVVAVPANQQLASTLKSCRYSKRVPAVCLCRVRSLQRIRQ